MVINLDENISRRLLLLPPLPLFIVDPTERRASAATSLLFAFAANKTRLWLPRVVDFYSNIQPPRGARLLIQYTFVPRVRSPANNSP